MPHPPLPEPTLPISESANQVITSTAPQFQHQPCPPPPPCLYLRLNSKSADFINKSHVTSIPFSPHMQHQPCTPPPLVCTYAKIPNQLTSSISLTSPQSHSALTCSTSHVHPPPCLYLRLNSKSADFINKSHVTSIPFSLTFSTSHAPLVCVCFGYNVTGCVYTMLQDVYTKCCRLYIQNVAGCVYKKRKLCR